MRYFEHSVKFVITIGKVGISRYTTLIKRFVIDGMVLVILGQTATLPVELLEDHSQFILSVSCIFLIKVIGAKAQPDTSLTGLDLIQFRGHPGILSASVRPAPLVNIKSPISKLLQGGTRLSQVKRQFSIDLSAITVLSPEIGVGANLNLEKCFVHT
jgi:hypothetical protein